MVQSNAPAEIYQLHILLLQINPPIWRRLHVRSDSSIATLHELLQIAFDWSDFHLRGFVIRGKEYGLSRIGCTTWGLSSSGTKCGAPHFVPLLPKPHFYALLGEAQNGLLGQNHGVDAG